MLALGRPHGVVLTRYAISLWDDLSRWAVFEWCGAIGVADTPSLRRYGTAHHTRRIAGHASFTPAGRFFIAFPRDNPTKPTEPST